MSQTTDDAAYDPLRPVPAAMRALTGVDAFTLWFSLGIGLLVLQSGALLVPGLGLTTALFAIVAGSLLGALLLGAGALVGAETGVASMAGLRPALGVRGAAVPALLNTIQLVGWGAFELVAMATTADELSKRTFAVSSTPAWAIGFGVLTTLLAVLGPVSLVRRFLRRYGVWLVIGGAGWLTWQLLARHDLATIFSKRGDGALNFAQGIDLVVAMPISWLPLVADYSRFGAEPAATFKGSTLGYLIANVWFFALGACYALVGASGDTFLYTALSATGGGIALLLIIIDETDNAFADVFSAAASTGTLIRLKVSRLALFYGALCTGIALFVPVTAFESFLYLIGAIFAPLFAVLFVDHFIVRRRKFDADAIMERGGAYWYTHGFNMMGFAAWIAGMATYQTVTLKEAGIGATLPSIAVAAVTYFLLTTAAGLRQGGPPPTGREK